MFEIFVSGVGEALGLSQARARRGVDIVPRLFVWK